MNNLLDEKWLEALPDKVTDNLIKQNAEVITVICERIKYFGNLRPTEVAMLTNSLAFAGADMKVINKIIQKYTRLNKGEINKIFETAAKENDVFAEQYYKYRGLAPKTHNNNEYLKNIYRAIRQSTVGNFENLSDTYGFKLPGKKAMTLRKAYSQVIDKAIYEMQTGITDYNAALRQIVKQLADSGIRTINWESGVSRRADTAARMNILDGVRRLNQEMLLYNGEQFGSDGIELSAHAISAPDHVNVQGRQFSNTEFNKMQDGDNCTDINGNTYAGFERPIGEYNCRHFAFPIVIGVSQPVHTDDELLRLKQNSAEKYEVTQEMRRRETEIRKLKDRRMAFSAAGNELDAKRTQRDLNNALRDYGKFCKNNGLTPKFDRAGVNGYRRISTVDKALKNDIINTEGEEMGISVEIDKFTPCLVEAKSGKIVETEYSLASQSDLKTDDWNFNWSDNDLKKSEIYKLTLKGDNTVQGLIALNDFKKDNAVYIKLVESAPNNIGKSKMFEGVGGHLFAIAIQKSVERGYGGFVFMDAKNIDLVDYYQQTLKATHIGGAHPYRMFIDEDNAIKILKTYTLEEK